jgi:two-component system, OmpR family, phosphate regulon sensor histidine kinase PhoR
MPGLDDFTASVPMEGVASEDAVAHERAWLGAFVEPWLTAIVEQMPDGLIIVEAPGGRVLTVNEQARRLLQIAEGDALHGIDLAYKPDGTRYRPEEFPIARALEGETVAGELLEIPGPQGARFVVSVHAAPVRVQEDRITAAVALLEDLTAERVEREFVTNAAHELQTPIAAITSAVEVLQAGAKDTPDRDLFIEHIKRQSDRLVRLTGALLTLSRAQADLEEPRSELIELCPLLEKIAERMEPAEGVSLAVDCAPEIALVANRELLEQLISNVVRNAVKYTEEGSIRVEAEPRDGQLELRVVDTGIGISAGTLPRVTERFYRGDASKEGFGLGLAIVRSALDVMGGELRIASQGPGQGTTVTMVLPHGATRLEGASR